VNTKIIKSFLVVLCLFVATITFATPVKIFGKALQYAQNNIELYSLHDFITEEKIKLGTIHFDAQGTFDISADLEQITMCYADFDGYQGMIYLVPGKSYELLFPPKRNLTAGQKRNPFLKPEPIMFGIKDPADNDLNVLIQSFEVGYSNYESKYFDQIFLNQSGALVDTVKNLLDKEFPKTNNAFFEAHKTFRKANLEFALHQGKSPTFMSSYFQKREPMYNLTAYGVLFNQVFVNYFSQLDNSNQHTSVSNLINTGNLAQLDAYFQEKLHFNKELSHLVLLKSIKDAYYSKSFSKASLLKMLEQVKESNWSDYEKKTAQLIQEKLNYLNSGTRPPLINLTDQAGRAVRFADYPNTYIYLHFTDPANIICRQHLEALKAVAARYKGNLVIINVIPDIKSFKNEAGWPGIFTSTSSNIESTYKVKTFPSSFLIGKDGRLLLSPAPNPIDGLDRQIGQIMKNDHIREMQKANGQNGR
jgi:hypothetical protein